MRGIALVAVVAACGQYDAPWPVQAAVISGPLDRAEVGLDPVAAVAPGTLWLALGDDEVSVAYPVVEDPDTAQLVVLSAFVPFRVEPQSAIVTRTSHSAAGQPDVDTVQYATLRFGLVSAPSPPPSGDLAIHLVIDLTEMCESPPDHVGGTVTGCLDGSACPDRELERQADASYLAGPLHVHLEVQSQYCVQ